MFRLPENLHSNAQRSCYTRERPRAAQPREAIGRVGRPVPPLVFVPGLADILDLTDKIEQLPGFICTPIQRTHFEEQPSVSRRRSPPRDSSDERGGEGVTTRTATM